MSTETEHHPDLLMCNGVESREDCDNDLHWLQGPPVRAADYIGPVLADVWKEGWLAGNRWAFTDADEDAIETNPYNADA